MVVTPTNHTTGAFFGDLEAEPSQSWSTDEQSSIDCSQLIESSTHTNSLLGGLSAIDVSNHPSRKGANASVLESVLEETGTNVEDSSVQHDTSVVSDPIFEELRKQGISGAKPMERNISSATKNSTGAPSSNSVFVSMPSKTLHTSNVDFETYRRMEEESDRFAAWAIHVVLGIFCGLVLISVLLTFFVIQKYGLVAMMGLMLVLCFVVFLSWFVDKTILSKDAKLRPIRNKIIRVVDVAKQAVIEEFNLFQRDWNEHYLLTNEVSMDEGSQHGDVPHENNPRSVKKKRSAVFRMIKPAFRFGRKMFRGKGNKPKKQNLRTQKYHPPSAENGIIA